MKGYIRKRGKSYAYTVDIGRDPITGKRKQKSKSGFKTKKEAQAALAELIASVEKGTFYELRKVKFREFAEDYLYKIYKNKVKPSTFEYTEALLENHIFPYFQDVDIQKVDSFLVHDFMEHKRQEGCSVNNLINILRPLKFILKQAFKQQIIERDIAPLIENPRREKKEMNVWTIEQANTFLEQTRESRYHIVFYLAIYTGMRRGEILGLSWSDINFEKKYIHIKKSLYKSKSGFQWMEPKTKSSQRFIYMDDDLMKELRRHQLKQKEEKMKNRTVYQDKGLVFAKPDGDFTTPNTVNGVFRWWVKKTDMPEIRFHDLRHTHATILLEMGVNPKVVSERLGHANIQTTLDVYSHVSDHMKQDLSEKFSEKMKNG